MPQNQGLNDLARQLGSLVDQIALLGAGPAQNQPTAVGATAGVNQIVPLHPSANIQGPGFRFASPWAEVY